MGAATRKLTCHPITAGKPTASKWCPPRTNWVHRFPLVVRACEGHQEPMEKNLGKQRPCRQLNETETKQPTREPTPVTESVPGNAEDMSQRAGKQRREQGKINKD